MSVLDLDKLLSRVSNEHRIALEWFLKHQGQEVSWPGKMDNNIFLVNKAKGIHKPAGWKYALSVRQSLNGPYADKEPVYQDNGAWTYEYFQEAINPSDRDAQFTNVALLACQQDRVPVGVIRQIKAKPHPRYTVLGIAMVGSWQDGYFILNGFSPDGVAPIDQKLSDQSEASKVFDPTSLSDARKWTNASIVRRQGQGKFRVEVLGAYQFKCAISGCDVAEAIEAAHIFGYLGKETNVPTNGLALRADIHTLYDLGLIAINPETLSVEIAPKLRGGYYSSIHGKRMRLPLLRSYFPSPRALKLHYDWAVCAWTRESNGPEVHDAPGVE